MKIAIVWDWDNTLMDTSEIIYQAQRDLFLVYKKTDLPRADAFTLMNKSARDWMPEVFGADWQEAYRFYLERYAAHISQIKPKPFAKEILAKAQKEGFLSVVVSKKMRYIIHREALSFDLNNYLTRIIGSGDAKEDKPSIVALKTALDGLDIDKVIVIGDAVVDMKMAKEYGAISVLLRKQATKEKEFAEGLVDYYASDLKEAWKIFQQIKDSFDDKPSE